MVEKWGIALTAPHLIVRDVKSHRIHVLMVILAAGWVCTGCGGVSGSHSVSPASFFLPGLIQHNVPEPRPDDAAPVPVNAPGTDSTPEAVAG